MAVPGASRGAADRSWNYPGDQTHLDAHGIPHPQTAAENRHGDESQIALGTTQKTENKAR